MLFSQRNTGTDPNHIDSDGDLYPDDIELRAGLDPNDDASVPEHVELSLPVPGLAPGAPRCWPSRWWEASDTYAPLRTGASAERRS